MAKTECCAGAGVVGHEAHSWAWESGVELSSPSNVRNFIFLQDVPNPRVTPSIIHPQFVPWTPWEPPSPTHSQMLFWDPGVRDASRTRA